MSEHKRRLGLLPEILPAPSGSPEGGPRDRTLAHMRKLLIMATATTTIDACEPGYGVVDPPPPPAKCTPPFQGNTTATRDGDIITVSIEATSPTTSRIDTPRLIGGVLLSSQQEGNKLTMTFSASDKSTWTIYFSVTCSGKDADLSLSITWLEDKETFSLHINQY